MVLMTDRRIAVANRQRYLELKAENEQLRDLVYRMVPFYRMYSTGITRLREELRTLLERVEKSEYEKDVHSGKAVFLTATVPHREEHEAGND